MSKKEETRNEGRSAAGRQTYETIFRKMTFTHPLNLSRTGEARAPREVHGLHAHGEHDLVDSTCGSEGEERERIK